MKKPKYNYPKLKLLAEYEYVKIERASAGGTPSDTGETGLIWTEVYAEAKASIHPLSNANKANFKQLSQGTSWQNYRLAIFEWDTDIQARDRITQYDDDVWYVSDVQPYPKTHREALISMIEEVIS
jgi:hypothetical protein